MEKKIVLLVALVGYGQVYTLEITPPEITPPTTIDYGWDNGNMSTATIDNGELYNLMSQKQQLIAEQGQLVDSYFKQNVSGYKVIADKIAEIDRQISEQQQDQDRGSYYLPRRNASPSLDPGYYNPVDQTMYTMVYVLDADAPKSVQAAFNQEGNRISRQGYVTEYPGSTLRSYYSALPVDGVSASFVKKYGKYLAKKRVMSPAQPG